MRFDHDAEEYWGIVHELRRRGDRKTFQRAAELATSIGDARRVLGIDVFAQLGYAKGRPYLDESPLIVVRAARDPVAGAALTIAAVSALGHLGDERGLDAALRHRVQGDERVRFAVAVTLPSVAGDPPSDRLGEWLEESGCGDLSSRQPPP